MTGTEVVDLSLACCLTGYTLAWRCNWSRIRTQTPAFQHGTWMSQQCFNHEAKWVSLHFKITFKNKIPTIFEMGSLPYSIYIPLAKEFAKPCSKVCLIDIISLHNNHCSLKLLLTLGSFSHPSSFPNTYCTLLSSPQIFFKYPWVYHISSSEMHLQLFLWLTE